MGDQVRELRVLISRTRDEKAIQRLRYGFRIGQKLTTQSKDQKPIQAGLSKMVPLKAEAPNLGRKKDAAVMTPQSNQ